MNPTCPPHMWFQLKILRIPIPHAIARIFFVHPSKCSIDIRSKGDKKLEKDEDMTRIITTLEIQYENICWGRYSCTYHTSSLDSLVPDVSCFAHGVRSIGIRQSSQCIDRKRRKTDLNWHEKWETSSLWFLTSLWIMVLRTHFFEVPSKLLTDGNTCLTKVHTGVVNISPIIRRQSSRTSAASSSYSSNNRTASTPRKRRR